MFAQFNDHTEIVVFESVPEIGDFAGEKLQPGHGIGRDVIARLVRPMPGNFGALERSPGRGFGLVDRIAEHLTLTGVQTGKARIAGRLRVVPQPKINAAVGREKDRITRHEAVVDPTRRRADKDSSDD